MSDLNLYIYDFSRGFPSKYLSPFIGIKILFLNNFFLFIYLRLKPVKKSMVCAIHLYAHLSKNNILDSKELFQANQ